VRLNAKAPGSVLMLILELLSFLAGLTIKLRAGNALLHRSKIKRFEPFREWEFFRREECLLRLIGHWCWQELERSLGKIFS
jgi:hypothetical protein